MQSRGERVVGALRKIDVVVGVEQLFTGDLVAAVGYDFVEIHVSVRTAAGLPYRKRKIGVVLARRKLVADAHYQTRAFFIQNAKFQIGFGARLFDDGERAQYFARHFFFPYLKIFQAALRLSAPVFLGLHVYFAHAVPFGPEFHGFAP